MEAWLDQHNNNNLMSMLSLSERAVVDLQRQQPKGSMFCLGYKK